MDQKTCPYMRLCGGCQKDDPSLDIDSKAQRLASISGCEPETVKGEKLGYRNRMDFSFNGEGLGLKRRGTWSSFVDIKRCPIANDGVNELLLKARKHFGKHDHFDTKSGRGTYRYAVIRSTSMSSCVSIVLNPLSEGYRFACAQVENFAEKAGCESVLISRVSPPKDMSVSGDFDIIRGGPYLKESFLGFGLFFHAQGFFQNNTPMAIKLHKIVARMLSESESPMLLDLFSGVGSFGIVNSGLFEDVLMVESDPLCTDAARMNTIQNDIRNAKIAKASANDIHTLKIPKGCRVVCDPPRSGMAPKAIRRLLRLKPSAITYVSCDMQRLERELHLFRGYRPKSAAIIDMFPHTKYAESVLDLVPI